MRWKVQRTQSKSRGAPFRRAIFPLRIQRSLCVLRNELFSFYLSLRAEVEAQTSRGGEGREKYCSKRSRGEKEERAARQTVDRGAHRAGAEDDDGRQKRHHDEGQDEPAAADRDCETCTDSPDGADGGR